uniref:CSON015054 protein n=1 Tax=Culicoides sonorensis TaxID=179676 RepID=A0A336LSI4_CULSO
MTVPVMKLLLLVLIAIFNCDNSFSKITKHEKIIEQCNNESNLNENEKSALKNWTIPDSPKISCHLYCILKGFKWVEGRAQKIKNKKIERDFKKHGISFNATEFVGKFCEKRLVKSGCNRSKTLFECFLYDFHDKEQFKFVFLGKKMKKQKKP